MAEKSKRSITIRLDEPDLIRWVDSQNSAVNSIRTIIKMSILKYGHTDLPDALLKAQFGGNIKPTINMESVPVQSQQASQQTPEQIQVPVQQAPTPQPAMQSIEQPIQAQPIQQPVQQVVPMQTQTPSPTTGQQVSSALQSLL